MNTKSILSVCGISLLIGATAPSVMAREMLSPSSTAVRSQAAAKTFIIEDLGFGLAADLYRATCFAKSVQADVKDVGPIFFDTIFQVAVIGSAGGIQGKSSVRVSPKGGLSGIAKVSRFSGNGSLRAYILYTEVNAPGAETYDTIQLCQRADGSFVDPVTTLILDL